MNNQSIIKKIFPSFKLFLIELFSVVLGVILALMLNQWSENRAINKKVAVALNNIANEIQSNTKILDIVHRQNSIIFEDSTQVSDNDTTNTFTPAVQLQDTAWKTFLSAGLSTNVDYELLLLLSQTYSIQDIYKSFGYKVVESYLNITALTVLLGDDDKEDDIDDQIVENLQMVYNAEEPLLELYAEVLNKFDEIQIKPNNL